MSNFYGGKSLRVNTEWKWEDLGAVDLMLTKTFVFSCVAATKDSSLYSCPIYKKPVRTDRNYIAAVDLKTATSPDHWVLRGVALLCDIK